MPRRILDTPLTEQQEDQLIADWTACRLKGEALQAEIDHATCSRLFDDQVKLWQEVKVQGDKCHKLLVELRACRKARREIKLPPPLSPVYASIAPVGHVFTRPTSV